MSWMPGLPHLIQERQSKKMEDKAKLNTLILDLFFFSSLFKTQQLLARGFYPLPSLSFTMAQCALSFRNTLCSSRIPDSRRSLVYFTGYSKHKGVCLTCIIIIIITMRIIISQKKKNIMVLLL